jgi:hypothetical protein
VKCACHQSGSAANTTGITLCDLHAREFHRRIEDMRGPDDRAIWNAALDAAEAKLVGGNTSPMDVWMKQRIGLLRK